MVGQKRGNFWTTWLAFNRKNKNCNKWPAESLTKSLKSDMANGSLITINIKINLNKMSVCHDRSEN